MGRLSTVAQWATDGKRRKGNSMNQGMQTIIYPVKDLERAEALYAALLGVGPSIDEAYYVSFDAGDQHVGLDPTATTKG